VSKKELRRAARDAYPKAKRASTARSRGTGGAYGKRSVSVGPRSAGGGNVPKPPSFKRSAIIGIIWAVLYFAIIQWLWKSNAGLAANVIFAVIGALIFTGVFYAVDWFKFRRYQRQHDKSSSK
jgi:amino acid transporter